MSKARPMSDDEIDFYVFFKMLWDSKWLISIFIATGILIGGIYILYKEELYMSNISYSVYNSPSFVEEEEVISKFKDYFYSRSIFNDWKKSTENVSLEFEDFSQQKIINGFAFSVDDKLSLVTIVSDKKGYYILIRFNKLPLLYDLYRYANFVNSQLKKHYLEKAQRTKKIIENLLEGPNSISVDYLIEYIRFIDNAGGGLLKINKPTLPKKIEPNVSLIVVFSLALSLLIGIIYIILSNNFRKQGLSS